MTCDFWIGNLDKAVLFQVFKELSTKLETDFDCKDKLGR